MPDINDPALLDQDVTVYFNSDAPTLSGAFRGFRNGFQYIVVEDGVDPSISHLVQDFAYASIGGVSAGTSGIPTLVAGDPVEVEYTAPTADVTGVFVAIHYGSIVEVLVGGTDTVFCDNWHHVNKL